LWKDIFKTLNLFETFCRFANYALAMKKKIRISLLLLIAGVQGSQLTVSAQTKALKAGPAFDIRIIADKLSDPWEITCGPEGQLWVTESKGYRVLQIDPKTGRRKVLLDLNGEKNFPRYDKIADETDGGKPWPQGGLMGMALHPDLLKGKPYVYLAYIYNFKGANAAGDGKQGKEGYQYLMKIVRYTYDLKNAKLVLGRTICDTIPASNDHNGGRLAIAETGGKPYLFYSVGDMGAGQFLNGGRTNKAQNTLSYEGKVLRYELEPAAGGSTEKDWIPADNPFNTGRKNAVWSRGHRNPQGLAAAKINGKDLLYSTEHGAYSDDEINLIEKGSNYGHPLVMGYADGNYNGLAASVSDNKDFPGKWHTSYPLIVSEQENAKGMGPGYRNPIKSFYPAPADTLNVLFNKLQQNIKADWSSFAPSSIAVYQSESIPGWKNSLLIPTLKGARLLRLQLNDNGALADEEVHEYLKGNVRYRDLAISADGLKIYLAVDSSSVTSGPSKEDPKQISYRGCIIEMKYKAPEKQPAKREE
jgi:PQQ-dependent dehydrogenase (s-GDH family)